MKKALIYFTGFVLIASLLVTSLSLAGCKSEKSTPKSTPKSEKPAPRYPTY